LKVFPLPLMYPRAFLTSAETLISQFPIPLLPRGSACLSLKVSLTPSGESRLFFFFLNILFFKTLGGLICFPPPISFCREISTIDPVCLWEHSVTPQLLLFSVESPPLLFLSRCPVLFTPKSLEIPLVNKNRSIKSTNINHFSRLPLRHFG